MRTELVEIYTAAELKERHPAGFARALEKHRERVREDCPWLSEIGESCKALFEAAGVKMRDWSVGAWSRSSIRAKFGNSDAAGLSGRRAWAWLENNLFGNLRVPWVGEERKKLRQYGADYYAGKVKPCPLTGYCADEDFLEALRASVRSGDTLKEAFEGLAGKWQELLEVEIEYAESEAYFLEDCAANEREFYADGRAAL